ncbi:hypothetical protein [Streptomyces sp. NPDC006267]|uniref:hypothetical protein n=1 Tax=Streptomyces sp. NPDC006267 TaxID=3157173 RepID=UPI0033A68494
MRTRAYRGTSWPKQSCPYPAARRSRRTSPRARMAAPAQLRMLVAPATPLAPLPGTLAATALVRGALDGAQ